MQRIHRPRDDGDAERPASPVAARELPDRALPCGRRRMARRTVPPRGCAPPPTAGLAALRLPGAVARRPRARRVCATAVRSPRRDDVGRAAGVHCGDRHAEGACFDQHAAEGLGPARGENQHRRVRHPRGGGGLIDPADHPDVAARACRGCRDRVALGAVPAMTSGQSSAGPFNDRDEVARALVWCELADVERVWPRHRWRRRPAGGDAARRCLRDSE